MTLLEDVIKKYIEAFNAQEVDKMISFFTEDCRYEVISNIAKPVICEGKQKLKEMSLSSNALLKERSQTVNNWVIAEHKVALEFTYHAIVAQDLPNGLKAGQALHLRGVSIYEFEGDKIKRLMDFG